MRIRQVGVSNLFGLFNHSIELNADERITIVHGPNGLGKTIVLRMLAGLMGGKYGVFRRVPFGSFVVAFSDASSLKVHTEELADTQLSLIPGQTNRRVTITLRLADGSTEVYTPGLDRDRDRDRTLRRHILQDRITTVLPFLTRVGPHTWQHDDTREMLDLEEVVERFGDDLHLTDEHANEPERIRARRRAAHVHLIQTQRLDSHGLTHHRHRTRSPTLTVERYSEELALRIRSVLEQYAAASQKLDRDFPLRLFKQGDVADLLVVDLRKKLDALEERRAKLKELGFLDLEENLTEVPDAAIEKKRDVFSIYVSDVEKKLAVFDDMAHRVELLTEIINARFLYKKIRVSREKGFLFTSDAGGQLQPADLSSGEQHELVLVYELIFNLQANSLVLIDEPEISLHIAWQEEFLRDIRRIVALSGFDVLIATHSPEIIAGRWDLTVELKGPTAPPART